MMKLNARCMTFCLLLVFSLSVTPCFGRSEPTKPESIPAELSGWKAWVLHGKEKDLCPTPYNTGEETKCQWPTRLQLTVEDHGGRFEQSWLMFAKDWVFLPGNLAAWPQGVKVDDETCAVTERGGLPSISLSPGQHRVTGSFVWEKLPETIFVSPTIGLVSLQIKGHKIDFPEIDPEGRLWLNRKQDSGESEELLAVRLFRLISDSMPMQITTLVRMDVSGKGREVRLPDLLVDALPMRIDSPLPAKLDSDGTLLCQVRPGQWDIRLVTRMPGAVSKLPCIGRYGSEIWSFEPQNHLRMVEIAGAPSVEPERTDMPAEWKRFPAYSLSKGATLELKEVRRGDPDPAPDRLTLRRTLWLDFDGAGYTFQDNIGGTMSRQWYLAMLPPGELGRVAVDGIDQLITRQGKNKLPGVALRRGTLALSADSRLNSDSRQLPAVGWDHDFESVSGTLNVPPGWRLLGTEGIDSISGTWIQNWSLLDFFLVIIISLSVMKLRNVKWGLLALLTLVLISHEPGAPNLVWLHIIAALALLKLLPGGWFRKLVGFWAFFSVGVLLVIAIPFMITQIRWGLFPQLVPVPVVYPQQGMMAGSAPMAPVPAAEMQQEILRRDRSSSELYELKKEKILSAPQKSIYSEIPSGRQAVLAADPNALIQTGPGLPNWRWQSFNIGWNGPVDRNQTIRLWLISPFWNLILGVLRAFLLAVLTVGLIDLKTAWPKMKDHLQLAGGALTIGFLVFLMGPMDAKADYPTPELLNELQQRLLEKPDCLPACASVTRMAVAVEPETLSLLLEIHAAARTAVPLPQTRSGWGLEQILLDQKPLSGLARDDKGDRWAVIPEGVHTVWMGGKIHGESLQLSLPMLPHTAKVDSRGWTVRGVHPDGSTDTTLDITRTEPISADKKEYENSSLPAFFEIQRVFHLGLTWRITTQIRRVSPIGTPAVLSYPLLSNESVITPGIHLEDKFARIAIAPGDENITFESNLTPVDQLVLKASTGVPWMENWLLDAGPIWQCTFSGIPPIHHQDGSGLWQPQWSPWPGESVTMAIERPESIAGKMVTIDTTLLDWTPGQRFDKAELTLSIRSSKGGAHEIRLPESADLQRVILDNKNLPIHQGGGKITVPLKPGPQKIRVLWNQPNNSEILVKPPVIGVGEEAVNAQIIFHMPQNRWLLFAGGPRLGPAVLFWSAIVVVIIAAFGLKRVRWTPLKFHHWLLLGLGLTQVTPITALVVVGWLIALDLRQKIEPPDGWFSFNLVQLIIVAWTIAALSGLYGAVERGLLGIPDMQIAGNQSTREILQWTQDRIASEMPRPWAISLPLWSYRVLMLTWSLWLAFSLLKWLKWGWQCFSTGKLWKKMPPRKEKKARKETVTQGSPGNTEPPEG
jgi:hypothetical protein